MMMFSTPEATASSTPYWMIGLSTRGSISLGWALVAGRKRVPRPAAGNTALRTRWRFVWPMESMLARGAQAPVLSSPAPEAALVLDLKYVVENRERIEGM